MTVGVLLHTVLFLLITALALLVAGSLLEKMAAKREAESFVSLAVLAAAISAAVHEVQKERAASAAFIASKGTALRTEMEAQRAITDRTLVPLVAELGREAAARGPRLAEAIEAARAGLGGLGAERAQIDKMEPTGGATAEWYTRLIGILLGIVPLVGEMAQDADVASEVNVLHNLLQATERAGQERATASLAFATGKLDFPYLRQLQTIAAEHATYFRLALSHMGQARRDLVDRTVRGAAVDEVERLRHIVIDSFSSGDVQGVTAAHWIEASTARIDLFHHVEQEIAGDLKSASDRQLTLARRNFRNRLATTAALAGLAFLLLYKA